MGKISKLVHYLPVFGCISTGLIYSAIGSIAVLSFFKVTNGGADESSLISFLNDYPAGKVLISFILSGTICYIIWRYYECVKDPYGYGTSVSGVLLRTGIALSTIADILIVYSVCRILLQRAHYEVNAQLDKERDMAGSILTSEWGKWFFLFAGAFILSGALVQAWYGIKSGYKERLEHEEVNGKFLPFIHFLAVTGFLARSIIIAITGFSFARAGYTKNADFLLDTDKSFDVLGDELGSAAFIAVAAGTIFYGLFMFVLGYAYDVDKD